MLKLFKKYKTGLILSGGGARGIAHLGVLKALNEKEIKPNIISAVSAGAIAGAFYADGYDPEEILGIFSNKKIFELMRITFPKTGFLKVKGLETTLRKHLNSKRLEDLKIPLIIATTNFKNGHTEYHSEGNLVDLLLASAGIPILFEIKQIRDIPYIDGGIMDNLPIDPIYNQCRKKIAVHVNPLGIIDKVRSPIQVAERSFHLAIRSDLKRKKAMADLFIEPEGLSEFGLLEVRKAGEMFDIGYNYTIDYLNDHQFV